MLSRRAAFAAIPLAGVAGCSTLNNWLNNPVIAAGLEDAFNLAAGLVLQSLGSNSLNIAQEIVAGITAIISAATGTTVTLATLQAEADMLISTSSLPSVAQAALEDVIEIAVTALAPTPGSVASTAPGGPLSTALTYAQNAFKLYLSAATSARGKSLLLKIRQQQEV